MRYLYSLLFYAALPFVLLRMLWRSRRRRLKGYRHRLSERFGYIDSLDPNTKSIWIHAVSVGEVIAAIPLIKILLQTRPQYTLTVTTTTPTGSQQVQKNFGNQVRHVYLPYDLTGPVKRFLKCVHPQLAIIMETELWPNLLYYTHQKKIPILLANARLSERSMLSYKRISGLTRKMLSQITCVASQSETDGKRFIRLGLKPDRLLLTGNVKFDLSLPNSLIQDGKLLRQSWEPRPTLIAASTHEGEEVIVLDAFRKLRSQYDNALLILVPRHPDRFTKVARLCENKGFSIAKRSLRETPQKADILLGDTLGELRLLYAASDVAFVGGSLISVGGHNLIEPAAVRLPIISGHHLHNFIAISELLKNANALIIVNDSEGLYNTVSRLFKNPQERNAFGERAYQVSVANTGAVDKHMHWINEQLLTSTGSR